MNHFGWRRRRGMVAAVLVGGVALASATVDAQPAMTCDAASFEKLALPKTRIVSAAVVKDDARAGVPHCVLRGAVNERTGSDGKPYAIGFEMRLPERWNGRYFDQVNGGNDGAVVPAYGGLGGNQPDSALARGYAVLSSDSGHDGQANRDAGLVGGNLFGFDEQARLDYGYTANVTLTPLAKSIIEHYYGRRPEYSYMVGCSNGGRHAMVGATRLTREFDGFLAGDPGFNLPQAALQHAWDIQSFAQADNDPKQAFSRDDMRLVASAVLAQCDALDGAKDGIVGALAACQKTFDVDKLACGADNSGKCLAPKQLAALKRSFAGPTDKKGRRLYASWLFDAGLGGNDWRGWKLESPIPGFDGLPLIAVLGAGSLAQIFTTPPTEVAGTPQGLLGYLRGFDFDRDAPKIEATTPKYAVSAMDFMAPTDWRKPKLAELKAAGGKLIVYHGASDGAFSIQATIDWYEKLRANNAELPADWSKTRTRPLCEWPKVARYRGTGDLESAASFQCE